MPDPLWPQSAELRPSAEIRQALVEFGLTSTDGGILPMSGRFRTGNGQSGCSGWDWNRPMLAAANNGQTQTGIWTMPATFCAMSTKLGPPCARSHAVPNGERALGGRDWGRWGVAPSLEGGRPEVCPKIWLESRLLFHFSFARVGGPARGREVPNRESAPEGSASQGDKGRRRPRGREGEGATRRERGKQGEGESKQASGGGARGGLARQKEKGGSKARRGVGGKAVRRRRASNFVGAFGQRVQEGRCRLALPLTGRLPPVHTGKLDP